MLLPGWLVYDPQNIALPVRKTYMNSLYFDTCLQFSLLETERSLEIQIMKYDCASRGNVDLGVCTYTPVDGVH